MFKNWLYKKSKQIESHLFYSKKESWWLIGFSMILSGGLMIEPQLICASLLNGELSDMWLYWSAGIGSAFSISFFAHLWQNVPVKTENEFIFFRFSGSGAKILHHFRSLYLGFIIIPFIISFSVLAFAKICCSILKIDLLTAILLITSCLLLLTFFNNFSSRLRMDFALFIVFIVLSGCLFITLLQKTGGLSHLAHALQNSKNTIQIIPTIGSKTFNAFMVFVFVQWWSAAILDYPDMNGQKLMASNSSKDLTKSVLLPSLFIILFRLFLFTLPFMAVLYGFSNNSTDSELAFTNLFVKVLPNWMLPFVVGFFLIPFLSFVQNNQNWGGALLTENFYKHNINPNLSDDKGKKIGIIAMLYIITASGGIALYADSLIGITKYLFAITAGVGPVFMLRWYWWRINAWSQLSAMIAALLYPPILDGLYEHNTTIHRIIMQWEMDFTIEYYPIKLIILTVWVSITWLVITFLTPPTEKAVLQNFVSTIKPGGFWNTFTDSGQVFSKLRILAWLLQVGNAFLIYFIFWCFVIGDYTVFIALFLVYIVFFFASYKLIQKSNTNYNLELEKKTI